MVDMVNSPMFGQFMRGCSTCLKIFASVLYLEALATSPERTGGCDVRATGDAI